jgi:cellulose synthase (UDP-forming)
MRFSAWKFFFLTLVSSFIVCDVVLLSQNMSGIVTKASALTPLLMVLALGLMTRAVFPDRPPVWLKAILSLGAAAMNGRYLWWRMTETLVLDWYNGPLSVLLVAMEAIAVLNTLIIISQTVNQTNHSPKADKLSGLIRSGQYQPTVDIFIPTYDEPGSVLQRTMVGAMAMSYPKKTVWLLDDGERPEMEALATELGVRYLARTEHSHAKAGNLNHGFKNSSGEIIITFDADFVPLNNFIERALGFFIDPELAMIVTPQNFYNPDPPELNLGGRILPHEQTVFYSILQAGRDSSNSVICTGTSILFRRKCIEELGGFPTDTIVEDWVTGMSLQAKGYRTMYLNEMLSVGAAPYDLGAYLVQRIRWAEGTLKTALSRYCPLFTPGFSLTQRINHMSGVLYWIDQATQSFAYIAPVLYLFFGMRAISTNIPDILSYWAATYLYGLFIVSWVTGCRTIVVSFTYNILQCFHLLPVVVKTILFPHKRVKFKTTPKEAGAVTTDYKLMSPLLVLLFFNLLSIMVTVVQVRPGSGAAGSQIINLLWAQFNLLILGLGILASMASGSDRRSSPRVQRAERCCVHIGHPNAATHSQRSYSSELLDISESGAAIRLPASIHVFPSDELYFSVPGETFLLRLKLKRGSDDNRIMVAFDNPARSEELDLIRFVYTRPHRWKRPQVANELQAFQAIFVSLLEMRPFRQRSAL